MVAPNRSTVFRISSDIWQKVNPRPPPYHEQLLFPSAALRIADHHLHASGIIERRTSKMDSTSRLYEHDWFCASQVVKCYTFPDLMHSVANATTAACDVWVDTVGKSSVQIGNALSLDGIILAIARRVMVRKEGPASSHVGKSAFFTDAEVGRFMSDYSLAAMGILGYYDKKEAIKLRNLPPLERLQLPKEMQIMTGNLPLISPPSAAREPILVLTVRVGPQHVNFGNHADHAFLAETAFHAMTMNAGPVTTLTIQYMSEVFLGNTLEVFACFEDDTIVMMTTNDGNDSRNVVLIAKGS